MTKLKFFTLNVWGLPFLCPHRRERIEAIGNELAKGEYDIVVLQEVWLKGDYRTLVDKICPVMPHTHYFYSGMLGSGACMFSKGPIHDVQFFRFHLNGYAHKLQHGDWFGGKGVGMCKVDYKGLHINVYTAHLHAEYDRLNDEYHSHRLAQAFELSQIVKLTSGNDCDLVVFGGDLNHEPVDLGLKVILENACLGDAWVKKPVSNPGEPVTLGNTCSVPTNSFNTLVSKSDFKISPDGKRIDYILYKSRPGKSVVCTACDVPGSRVPDNTFNFSDHEPVSAELEVTDSNEENPTPFHDPATLPTLLLHSITAMDAGLKKTGRSRSLYLAILIACIVGLFTTFGVTFPSLLDPAVTFIRGLLVVGAFYSLTLYVVVNRGEENGHREVISSMTSLVAHLTSNKKRI